jgi:diacylglycerol kinase family enzyme
MERVSITGTLGLAARGILRSKLERQRGAQVFHEFEKLIIHAEPSAGFQADGEMLGKTDSVEITPAYDALSIVVPHRN